MSTSEVSTDSPTIGDDAAVELWGRVIRGFQVTNRLLHARCKARFGLNEAEVETLLTLHRTREQRATLNTLSTAAAFTTGGFTKIADKLVERGLAMRSACEADRRVTYLELTDEGLRTAAELTAFVAEVNRAHIVDVLGRDRAEAVAAAMTELYRAHHDAGR